MNAFRSVALAAVILVGAAVVAAAGCKKVENDAGDSGRGGTNAQGGSGGSSGSGGGGVAGDGGRAFNGGACPVADPAGMTCDLEDDTCATSGAGGKVICTCRLDSFGIVQWACAPDVDAGDEEDQAP